MLLIYNIFLLCSFYKWWTRICFYLERNEGLIFGIFCASLLLLKVFTSICFLNYNYCGHTCIIFSLMLLFLLSLFTRMFCKIGVLHILTLTFWHQLIATRVNELIVLNTYSSLVKFKTHLNKYVHMNFFFLFSLFSF